MLLSRSAVARDSPGTDREIAALADQFQQLRPEILNTLSEFLSKMSITLDLNKKFETNMGLRRGLSN